MENDTVITTLFLDIGGVLLSNGWGRASRQSAATVFNLDTNDMEDRHHLNMVTCEEGKITLDEYLHRVVFHRKRHFTLDQFRDFMFAQTTPDLEMIALIKRLKIKYQLKVAVVSNEGREMNAYRIDKFQLNHFVDFFISSCFVHLRKPDTDMFRLALDLAQVPKENVLYIDDVELFVEVAGGLGIRSIQHKTYAQTSAALKSMGLSDQ